MRIFDDFDLDIQKVNSGRGGDRTPSEQRESCATCDLDCLTKTLNTAVSDCIPCPTDTCVTMCYQAGCPTVNVCGTLKVCTME